MQVSSLESTSIANPRCVVIAGPNGAGKTTFAREFLPKDAGVLHFVNADLIAAGLSPFRPDFAAVTAGRLVLTEVDRLAKARASFGTRFPPAPESAGIADPAERAIGSRSRS